MKFVDYYGKEILHKTSSCDLTLETNISCNFLYDWADKRYIYYNTPKTESIRKNKPFAKTIAKDTDPDPNILYNSLMLFNNCNSDIWDRTLVLQDMKSFYNVIYFKSINFEIRDIKVFSNDGKIFTQIIEKQKNYYIILLEFIVNEGKEKGNINFYFNIVGHIDNSPTMYVRHYECNNKIVDLKINRMVHLI